MSLLEYLNNHGKKVLPLVMPAVSFLSPMNVDAKQPVQPVLEQKVPDDHVQTSLQYFQERCQGTDDEKQAMKSLLSDLYRYPEGKNILSQMDKRTSFGFGQPNGGGTGIDPENCRIGLTVPDKKKLTDPNSQEYKEALVSLYHEAIHSKQINKGQYPFIEQGMTGTDFARNYKMLEVETFAKEVALADKVYGADLPQEMDAWKKKELEVFRTYKSDFQEKNPGRPAEEAGQQASSRMVEDLWTAPQRLDMKTPLLKQENMYDESLVQWHHQRTQEALNVYAMQKKKANTNLVKDKTRAEAQMKMTADEIGAQLPMTDWTRKLSLEKLREAGAPTEQQLEDAYEKWMTALSNVSSEKNTKKAEKAQKRALKDYQNVKSNYQLHEDRRLSAGEFFKNEDAQTVPGIEAGKNETQHLPSTSSNQNANAVSAAVASSMSSQR